MISSGKWLIVLCAFSVEKNPSLVKLYKEKMTQYLQRAEYIKKTVLDVPDQPESGGTATAQKPKTGGTPGEEDNKEEENILRRPKETVAAATIEDNKE